MYLACGSWRRVTGLGLGALLLFVVVVLDLIQGLFALLEG